MSTTKKATFATLAIIIIIVATTYTYSDYYKKHPEYREQIRQEALEKEKKRFDNSEVGRQIAQLKEIARLEKEAEEKERMEEEKALDPNPPGSQWLYMTGRNQMTGLKYAEAKIRSANQVEFGFPYEGKQRATLVFLNRNNGLDILLRLDKGHFVCQEYGKCKFLARFDEEPAREFSFYFPTDDSRHAVFISYDFFEPFSKAKIVKTEFTFYQSGNRIFKFAPSGLDRDILSN